MKVSNKENIYIEYIEFRIKILIVKILKMTVNTEKNINSSFDPLNFEINNDYIIKKQKNNKVKKKKNFLNASKPFPK